MSLLQRVGHTTEQALGKADSRPVAIRSHLPSVETASVRCAKCGAQTGRAVSLCQTCWDRVVNRIRDLLMDVDKYTG